MNKKTKKYLIIAGIIIAVVVIGYFLFYGNSNVPQTILTSPTSGPVGSGGG